MVSERVEDLLSRMTLEEKCAQLCGDLPFSLISDPEHLEEKLREQFPDGHGRFTQYSNVGIADPKDIAEFIEIVSIAGYPAKGLASLLVDECNKLYGGEPRDDVTA